MSRPRSLVRCAAFATLVFTMSLGPAAAEETPAAAEKDPGHAVFSTAGTSTWTVPKGVKWILVRGVGGGGGGGGGAKATNGGLDNGGGGGRRSRGPHKSR